MIMIFDSWEQIIRIGTYSGKEIDIDIVWLDRESHNYSSTKLKTDIFKSILPRACENYD